MDEYRASKADNTKAKHDYDMNDKASSFIYGVFGGLAAPVAGLATVAFNGAVTTPVLDAALAAVAAATLVYQGAKVCTKDGKPEHDMKKVVSGMVTGGIAALSLIFAAHAGGLTGKSHDIASPAAPCTVQQTPGQGCTAPQPVQKI